MKRELAACVTELDRHNWAEKWARILNGSAQRDEMAAHGRMVEALRPQPR